jgi:hypothetical protein
MNLNFFKTNWFAFAMAALLLLSVARKYPRLNPFASPAKSAESEKITEGKNAQGPGASLLGLIPEPPKALDGDAGIPNDVENRAVAEAFLKRFAPVAVSERKKFGIPASIILACAYANSEAGKRESAKSANNFFGLACADDWEGENAQIGGECVRRYETAWASFRDFSIFLTSQEWFGSLKKSAGKDWHKWAAKLGSEGVSNTQSLKKVVETYKLDALD